MSSNHFCTHRRNLWRTLVTSSNKNIYIHTDEWLRVNVNAHCHMTNVTTKKNKKLTAMWFLIKKKLSYDTMCWLSSVSQFLNIAKSSGCFCITTLVWQCGRRNSSTPHHRKGSAVNSWLIRLPQSPRYPPTSEYHGQCHQQAKDCKNSNLYLRHVVVMGLLEPIQHVDHIVVAFQNYVSFGSGWRCAPLLIATP